MNYRDVSSDPKAQRLVRCTELRERLAQLGFTELALVRVEPEHPESLASLYEGEDRLWFRRAVWIPVVVLVSEDGNTLVDLSEWWGGEPAVRMRTQLRSGALVETMRAIDRMPVLAEEHGTYLAETGQRRQRRGHAPKGGRSVRRVETDDPAVLWAEHQVHRDAMLAQHQDTSRPLNAWEDYERLARISNQHDQACRMAATRVGMSTMVGLGLLVASVAVPLSAALGAFVGVLWLVVTMLLLGSQFLAASHRIGGLVERWVTPDLPEWSGATPARAARRRRRHLVIRGGLFAVIALVITLPTAWIALTRMPGFNGLRESDDAVKALTEQIETQLDQVHTAADLAEAWTAGGHVAESEDGAVTLRLGDPASDPLVVWAGPEATPATLVVLSVLPDLLLEVEGTQSLVLAAGMPEQALPAGLSVALGDLAASDSDGMSWPFAPAWGPAGSQVQVTGSWSARQVVREVVHQGRAVRAAPVQGLLDIRRSAGLERHLVRVDNRGAWAASEPVEPSPTGLAFNARVVGAVVDGLLSTEQQREGPSALGVLLSAVTLLVVAFLGRFFWSLMDVDDPLFDGVTEESLEALGPGAVGVVAALDDLDLGPLISELERAALVDRYVWLDLVAHRAPQSKVDAWREAEPDNLLAWELTAWAAYLRARASRTTPYRWIQDGPGVEESGVSQLRASSEALERAMVLQPGVGAHFGVKLGLSALQNQSWPAQLAVFEAGLAVDPTSYALWQAMLSAAADHHGYGSPEVLRLARDGAKGAPFGSPLWALIAQAHVMRFEHLCDQEVDEPEEYLLDPAVVGELQHAFDRFHEGGPLGPEASLAYGWFRSAFGELDEPDRYQAAAMGARGSS